MTCCLVEQLFRQKIGINIDTNIVSSIMWHYLFKEKHLPPLILQDIHLVRQADPNGDEEDRRSAIMKISSSVVGEQLNIRHLRNQSERMKSYTRKRHALENLCGTDIVNMLRDMSNPSFITVSESHHRFNEEGRNALTLSPYMNNCIRLVERSDSSFLSRTGGSLDPNNTELAFIRLQQDIDKKKINSFIDKMIRNKATFKWQIVGPINNPTAVLSYRSW